MTEEHAAQLAALDRYEMRQEAALEALGDLLEDPKLEPYESYRAGLVGAFDELALWATCGDCVEGRCHWGGERSRQGVEMVAAGQDPGPCGCARHELSVEVRERRVRLLASGVLPPETTDIYLVWSHEHHRWWGPNNAGYTSDVWEAGRYDLAGAMDACTGRFWPEGTVPAEVMVLAPEAGKPTFTPDEVRGLPALMRDRITAATEERMKSRG